MWIHIFYFFKFTLKLYHNEYKLVEFQIREMHLTKRYISTIRILNSACYSHFQKRISPILSRDENYSFQGQPYKKWYAPSATDAIGWPPSCVSLQGIYVNGDECWPWYCTGCIWCTLKLTLIFLFLAGEAQLAKRERSIPFGIKVASWIIIDLKKKR